MLTTPTGVHADTRRPGPTAPDVSSARLPQPAVLFVDDDARILRGVERSLGARFAITTVSSASQGLALLQAGNRYAVVVSDLSMPGMGGIALLTQARRLAPDTVRVLFTGEAQLADAVRAVNEVEIFRLVLKPCTGTEMLGILQAAVRQFELVETEQAILRDTLNGAISALSALLAMANPTAHGRALRLRRHVGDLAASLGSPRQWVVEMAALLSTLGATALAPELVERWYHNDALTSDEEGRVARIPATSIDLLANIPRLEEVCEIIARQFEPPGTPGLPDGAKMLAIARDFDLLIAAGESAEHALAILRGRDGRYDRRMLEAFYSIRSDKAPAAEIRDLRLCDVRPGMIFAADVLSPRGVLLIARGQPVTPTLCERISHVWSTEAAASIPVRVLLKL